MCGIVALSNGDVPSRLYYGLYSLQHRGQDSCGIASYDYANKKFRMVRDQGLVADVFDEQSLENLEGNVGIGQVRYPTIGSNFKQDAQPVILKGSPSIAMAHNGNIANYAELVKSLTIRPKNSCDVEAILDLMGEEKKKEGDIFSAVQATMERLNGAYSVVAIVPGDGLIVFRDPHAIRPLVLGEHSAASESVALDIMGEKVVDDVGPGECIVISEGSMERRSLMPKEKRHCVFEWVYFSRPDSTIEKKSVYNVRLRLGEELARHWDKSVDVVVPVPDTARATALSFAQRIGVPYREGLIKNRYVGRTFIMPSQGIRENAVRVKLNPIISEVRGKSIAVVDDSIVRGTTSRKLVRLLRNAGASEVHLVSAFPPIRSPCFYGIDMTRNSELAASKFKPEDVEEGMAKLIGADSVTYQTVEGLKRAIGLPGLCTACIDGDYPTDVSALLKKAGNKRPYEVE